MKNRILATSLLLAMLPTAHVLAADAPAKAVPSPTAADFLEQFDPEDTGSVSWAQFEAFRKQRFAATDADGNGTVSKDEYVREYQGRLDERLEKARQGHLRQTATRFKALDRNGDGVIDRAEYDAAGKRTWDGYEKLQEATQETAAASSRDPLKMPTSHTANGMIEMYDRNGDKVVDREEFDAVRAASFVATDRNGDGRLDEAEYTAEFSARLEAQRVKVRADASRQAEVRFGVLNTSRSGAMTFEEFQVSGKRLFDRADTNRDGIVDARDPEPEARTSPPRANAAAANPAAASTPDTARQGNTAR